MTSSLLDFESFESKFKSIESKIKSKTERVHQLHESDVELINKRYDGSLIENVFAVNLNEQRDVMLKLVEQKRVQNISQVNESFENLDETPNAQEVLIQKSKLIKRLEFKKSRIPTFDCILNTYKINHPLDFDKFYKYTDLIIKKKKFNYNLPVGYKTINFSDNDDYHYVLGTDRLFLCVAVNHRVVKMLIINKQGKILHSKDKKDFSLTEHVEIRSSFAITHNKIIHFFRKPNEKITVYLYDFKLELIKSFKFNEWYGDTFCINNNSLGFQTDYTDDYGNETVMNRKNDNKILIYNYETMNSNYITLQRKKKNEPFFMKLVQYMVHFNKEYLYFLRHHENNRDKTLTVLYRATGVKIRDIRYSIYYEYYINSIKHDNYNGIMMINDNCNYFNIYKSNGDFLFSIPYDKSFNSFVFTPYQTNIFGFKSSEKSLEYYEY